jgi:hypothetical protein
LRKPAIPGSAGLVFPFFLFFSFIYFF